MARNCSVFLLGAVLFWYGGDLYAVPGGGVSGLVEADWVRQAKIAAMGIREGKVPSWADAAGAVDGVKDGKYAFHTGHEANPWWQVDLGESAAVGRIVVFNRLDYAPGLHNADNLIILVSDDGQRWRKCYKNGGRHFGGISGAKPLEVRFEDRGLEARYVRLQVPSAGPVFFHLDEVEVYAVGNDSENIALGRPADQSSISQWSTAKIDVALKNVKSWPIGEAMDRGRKLAADLRQMGVDTSGYERDFDAIAGEEEGFGEDASEKVRRELYLRARRVVRQLAMSNPLLDFDELVFVKRFTQETYPDVCLNHMPWVSRPGGDICVVKMKDLDGEGRVRNVIDGTLGYGHVRGMDLHWDGKRIVFGYARAKSNEPPEGWLDRRTNYRLRRTEEPIHIYEIGTDGEGLRQITDGEWSDLDPTYAPNGDIVFVSERCGYSLQCNELDKDETSCNLYVCRSDGSDIRRMSASKDGDYLPHTLADGTIGYTRWEYQERSWAYIQSIWYVRPDGTGADALFKQHLNDPWALEDVRSIPGGGSNRLAAIATGHHTLAAGPVVVITPSAGLNNSEGIRIVTPGVLPPEGGMSGRPVEEGGVQDCGGYYMTPWPLSEKYFLAAYSYSQEQTEPKGYGVYLIDVFGNKELLYRDEAISCYMPIPLRARKRPPVLPEVTDPEKAYAVCAVADVGRGVAGVARERIRYLRISHRLAWPYDNTVGGQRYAEKAWPHNWTPAKVIGTVPVEADGSAHFRVPADTPVYFQLLDENHMELRRMRSFISFQPGETRGCVGCHETRAEAAATAMIPQAFRREASIPTPPPWGDRAISFLRDVQPVFDRYCVSCHGGLKPEGGLDFSGGLTAQHNRAYDTILEHKLVAHSNVNEDSRITQPLEFGSHRSKLIAVLEDEPHKGRMDVERVDWLRLVTWIDLNAPYHDEFINKRPVETPYDLAADGGLMEKIGSIHAGRCGSCHAVADVTQVEWIDVRAPRRSLFLRAPLSAKAGGAESCGEGVYENRADADYRAVLTLVEDAVERARAYPRRDVRFLSCNE